MTVNRKPVVYLLHGLLTTAHYQYDAQVRAWKDALAVVPLDLPGHGHCPVDARRPYMATTVRFVLTVMNRFGPGHVIATSYLGGPVAVRCALERPELIRSLVLSGFVPDVPEGVFAAWVDGFGRLASDNPALTGWYEEMHGPRWQDTLSTYVDDVQHRYADDVRVTGEMLGMLQPATLIANGSVKSNERNAALEATRFGRHVRGLVIEGAGHTPSRDQPEAFDQIVHDFWKEITPGADVAAS